MGCPYFCCQSADKRALTRPSRWLARCGTRTQGRTSQRVLLVSKPRWRRRCSSVQPIHRSRAPAFQAAEPKSRQASGLPSRSRAKYFKFSPHAIAVSQIMVALQQELEEPGLGIACGHRLHLHRLQQLKRAGNGTLVVIHWGDLAIAQPVDRSRAPRRQMNVAASLQLQKQAARGHILELAGLVAPVPSRTQLPGEPGAIAVGMGLQPVSNQRDIIGAECPPLNDQWSVHWPTNTRNEKVSPAKKERYFGDVSAAGMGKPVEASHPHDRLCQNENCCHLLQQVSRVG